MKIRFFYKTDEWGKICESIKLYLQYCCHSEKKSDIEFLEYKPDISPDAADIIVVPLFEKVTGEITHHGLEVIKDLRKSIGYGFKTLFLVLSKQDIPYYFHPEKDMHYYAENMLGNPKFEDANKAVFLGEIVYEKKKAQGEKTSYEDIEYMNIINLQERDALGRLADLLKNGEEKLPPIDQKLREKYYDIFVKYYDEIKDGGKIAEGMKELLKEVQELYEKPKLNGMEQFPLLKPINSKKEVELIKLLLNKAQEIYNSLNNSDIGTSSHTVPHELFLAPVPFPLQDFFDVKLELGKELRKSGTQNKIRLLLIDNKTDKFKKQTKPTIIEALEAFGIDDLFDIEMIGIEKHDSKNFNPDYEEFQFKKFRDKKELENLEEKEYYQNVIQKYKYKEGLVKTYSELIYNKIRSFHFILLDFFLNGENTYFAFDFIKDIAKIKNEKQDSSTTWYFITSAVYGSVVNYSQSGLLAEYYESAVVNAGDDPTNKKRQIIFLYKLLTFIQARIRSFKGFHDSVIDSTFLNCITKECKNTQCLIENQNLFRKYLAEFGEIRKVFPGKETEEKQFKETVELLDSTINQFLWLPEADWPMIQQQIEHINSRLEDIDDFKNRRFSCNYIREEIRKRSDIY